MLSYFVAHVSCDAGHCSIGHAGVTWRLLQARWKCAEHAPIRKRLSTYRVGKDVKNALGCFHFVGVVFLGFRVRAAGDAN